MTRRRLLLATAGALVAVTLPVLAGSPSGGTGISIPPTVGATQWTDYGAAAASTETTNVLTGVSCTSASFCAAVGDQNLDTDAGVSTLAELWNGSSWRIVPSPNPAGTADDALNAVSCVGPSFCLAVGGGDTSTLVVAWNGFTWNAVPAALPAGADTGGNLTAVSCVSANVLSDLGPDGGQRLHCVLREPVERKLSFPHQRRHPTRFERRSDSLHIGDELRLRGVVPRRRQHAGARRRRRSLQRAVERDQLDVRLHAGAIGQPEHDSPFRVVRRGRFLHGRGRVRCQQPEPGLH